MKLEGKVAIISGSGRGIGRATALKLASEGARVVVNDLDAEPAHETAAAIRAAGGEASVYVGSATEPKFGDEFVHSAITAFGGLDIIVNNAGFTWDSVIQKMTDEQFDAVIDIHLKAPFRVLRAASHFIRDVSKRELSEGREVYRKVVNVSSTSGVYGNAGQVNYAAGKLGVVGITKTLAKEWGRYRVNVNAVAFGVIQTRMTQPVGPEGAKVNVDGRELPVGIPRQNYQLMEAGIPLGRAGTPEEAANGVYLLCTPESNYITGHVLMVTGGM
jgi:3-oxoacyl-[acyl-carrier protein] reductase